MTPKQVRAALRKHFNDLGFIEDRSRFVCRTPELSHAVEITAVRRLPGTMQIQHEVSLSGGTIPLVTEEISSHGHNSPYPRIWLASSIDASLVLDQVEAICRSFQTRLDLAHFLSDRTDPDTDRLQMDAAASGDANSLSAAEASQALRRLAKDILGEDFSLASSRADFEVWASKRETEGYRHCVYLEANQTATLAVVVTFSLQAQLIAGGLRSEQAIRALMVAPKQVLFGHGRPILMPLAVDQLGINKQVCAALAEHTIKHPPHLLPR